MGVRVASRLVALAAFGIGGCHGEPGVAELGDGDDGARVELALSQEVHVTLHSVGPGQYGEPTVSSEAVRFLGMSFPAGQNPGGPTQLYRFEAIDHGDTAITIPHDGQAKPFTMTLVCCAQ